MKLQLNHKTKSMVLLAILPLATSAALVTYIIAHLSLLLGVFFVGMIGVAAAWFVWHFTPHSAHIIIRERALIGLGAGILATLSYDLVRYIIVTGFHFSFWPFDIFTIFGRLIVGEHAPKVLMNIAGVLYHYLNGIGFAIAFAFLFRKPNIIKGILWAAVLELFMVSLYPGWLGLKALDEFLSVSILGHAVYGTVLGSTIAYLLKNNKRKIYLF